MKNIMEDVVRERLKVILKDTDCCKCEQCIEDILAMSLNTIKPKYANSSAGELFGRVDAMVSQNSVDIDVAISRAVNAVRSMPRHGK